MSVLELDRDKWRDFKTANNLSKSSFFNKADVGPHIDKFQNALAAFKQSGSKRDLLSAFTRAEDLQKAFAKFIALKETKAELSATAKAKIEKWKQQLDAFATRLAILHRDCKDQLEGADREQMNGTLKSMFPAY